jgi:TolA-binding protein
MRPRILRTRILAAAALILLIVPAGIPAHAVAKEIVELQTQVNQLLDMVQRLQSTMDTKFGVLQHTAEQTADEANRMTAAVSNLQKQLDAQAQSVNGKTDAVSGQMQSLNDSVDEVKSRITKLDKSLQDLQTQLQQMQAPPPSAAPTTTPTGQPGGQASGAPGPQAPPLDETYQAGVRDFNAGKLQVAVGEFQDVIHYYPLEDMAGGAKFYLGEIAYQQENYPDAINSYNAVLEAFSGNAKAPAAQLHKGYALLATNKKDAGVRELRLLIQRYPQTPEARAARSKLNGMGVKTTAAAPAH